MRSTPHNVTSSNIAIRACFQPVQAPEKSALAGQTSPYPAAFVWLGGVLFADPLGECRRDANTLAQNGSKTRTLCYAHRELVRVPESNTKYGGGDNRGRARACC